MNRGLSIAGSLRAYEREKVEDTFVPLLDYKRGYNCPEVLIPFPVDAQIKWLYSFYLKIKTQYFDNLPTFILETTLMHDSL